MKTFSTLALTLVLGCAALGAVEKDKVLKQASLRGVAGDAPTGGAPAVEGFKPRGNLRTPTKEKGWIAACALPIVGLAFALVWLAEHRKLPKWASMVGCAFGLYAAHISYGVLQEYIMTQSYSDQPFPSIAFLVATNRIVATVFAFFVVRFIEKKPLGIFGGVDAEGSCRIACLLPSLTNVAATWFQYGSLWYVTFPTQMVFKSMKLLPVLICSSCFLKKVAPFREWMDAAIITAGVVAFAWFAEMDPSAGNLPVSSRVVGVLMLLGFLLCDAVTPSLQKRAFSNANLGAFQMMFWIGAASSIYAVAMLFTAGQTQSTIDFIMARPEALIDVVALSVIATVGQIFIYVTVQKHGPVSLSLIMTTRQVWSVLLSCVLFGHALPGVAIGAASMVFSVLLVRAYRSVSQPDELSRRSGQKGESKLAESESAAASDYVPKAEGPGSSSSASQLSTAFGLTKGFVGRFSAKAAGLSGKLRG